MIDDKPGDALIQVLLSTMNGEQHLQEQLQSVLGQSHRRIRLTVRDDGSTDGTVGILASWAKRDPRLSYSTGPNLGAARSFLTLLHGRDRSAAAYAFCDQDDVWEADRLHRGLQVLRRSGTTEPLLWFSDLLVCDDAMRPLRRHGVVRRSIGFENALVENAAPGSTILFNEPAARLVADTVPESPVMHDAWSYLVVSALGTVVYDSSPTVRYRLHGSNAVGLTDGVLPRTAARWSRLRAPSSKGGWRRQAAELLALHGDRLAPDRRVQLEAFLADDLIARTRYALTGRAYRQSRRESAAMRLAHAAGWL